VRSTLILNACILVTYFFSLERPSAPITAASDPAFRTSATVQQ
jgi:hypothetical protein